jgi:peptidoglycan/LPS O-acetylase OafA/YrhL
VGLIRCLLAAAVVVAHSRPLFGLTLTGALVSVQAFFMISGFYMALILNEKYTRPGTYKTFIVSRALRLFPGYYLLMLAYSLPLLVVVLQHRDLGPFKAYAQYADVLPLSSLLFVVFTNLAIFGQDIVMFLKFNPVDHTLQFTTTYWTSSPRVYEFLLMPQAWSLATELTFYLLVPFIVRLRTMYVIAITVASLLLRLSIAAGLGLNTDPWTGRFFPTELALFLFGVLSYRLRGWYHAFKVPAHLSVVAFVVCVVLIVFFAEIDLNRWIFYAYFMVAMPLIFDLTKKSHFDRRIGDLSYPIYISHLLVLWILTAKVFYDWIGDRYIAICAIACAVIVSMVVNRITQPIEAYRQRRVQSEEMMPAAPTGPLFNDANEKTA